MCMVCAYPECRDPKTCGWVCHRCGKKLPGALGGHGAEECSCSHSIPDTRNRIQDLLTKALTPVPERRKG